VEDRALDGQCAKRFYGKSSELQSSDGGDLLQDRSQADRDHRPRGQLPVQQGNWTLSVGANNLFNQYPDGINGSCWPSSAPTWTTRR
jgi:hypothetical protein